MEVTYVALKALYVLSSVENISNYVLECHAMEKLLLCLKCKNITDEIPRISAKIVSNIYSTHVFF